MIICDRCVIKITKTLQEYCKTSQECCDQEKAQKCHFYVIYIDIYIDILINTLVTHKFIYCQAYVGNVFFF